ncbi:MAG TPA: group II intron reverse transcriptase/maturase [Candidatus Paceibacterota bacterium]|nr:group II intron reverse transcriptase/maturase [Candidatus Paceibacterota bacterium]
MEKTRTEQQQLFAVSRTTKREREVSDRWSWTEPEVWTERMVDALERGVKGGKWHSLIDKVYAERTLKAAWGRVERNGGSGGVDGERIRDFKGEAGTHLSKMSEQLRNDQYEPMAIRRVYIPKLGSHELRPLGIPTIRDRIVQTALRSVIEPIFEHDFSDNSYGFRPKRSTKDALRHVQRLLDQGRTWVVDVDITRYFDTIPHQRLLGEVEKKIADGRVLKLIERYLKQEVLEGTPSYATEEDQGTPQGAVISPLLANIYLHPIDLTMAKEGYDMVRYADDSVVLCNTREEAERAMNQLRELMEVRGLRLHPEKTKLVDVTQPGGFDFLGYHFELGKRTPRKKSLRKFKDTIKARTRRANGHSLSKILEIVNEIVRGWFEYFKHCPRRVYTTLDAWIRRRIRSILRKREGRRGIARGADYQRWPNAFFRRLGLFTMAEAHAQLVRSLHETHRPESRMREIRTYGSEGGGAQLLLPL